MADREVAIRRPQERGVLAYLLLNAGVVVTSGQVVEAIWGGAAPATARTQVQVCVSHIRRALRDAGADGVLESHARGYRIAVDSGTLDLAEFDSYVDRGRSALARDPGRAADLFRAGLALWQGPALAGASGGFVSPAAAGLEERRLRAYEDLADAELALGRLGGLLPELSTLERAHPLRERLIARLMVALAADGRQAEAIELHAAARSRLVDELGVEPGAELADAHVRVLRQQVPAPAEQEHRSGVTGRTAVPAQLPATTVDFVGRAAELDHLHALLRRMTGTVPPAVAVSAIVGTAGIGKTAIAVHWAHQVADQFPDGQLYVNLRGFGSAGSVMRPREAIQTLLAALAVPESRLPAGLDAQAARYRSALAGKRMLVLLDNARNAEQIRPLLPGAPGSLVLVTSRNRLASLVAVESARPLTLGVLSADEAREFLSSRIGAERVAAETEAVAEINAQCAGLPLALAIVATRASTNPQFRLKALAAELRNASGGLDAFDADEPITDLRAVFSWSYRLLSKAAARLFRLLGLHPGPDFTTPVAASMAGLEPRQVRPLLSELTRVHLLVERVPGRYMFHRLLRAYAVEQAHRQEVPSGRIADAKPGPTR
jgi:DNA-binding SARP family transcriptional activator